MGNQHSTPLTPLNQVPLLFPKHIFGGDFILGAVGMKVMSGGNYDKFKGGDFRYYYESNMRDGHKCLFELISNQPMDDIQPHAVNIHSLKLTIQKVNEKNESELMLSLLGDNFGRPYHSLQENRRKIAEINEIVGISQLSYSDRASWDIMMEYLGISGHFQYYSVVPGSDNLEFFREVLKFRVCELVGNGEIPTYRITKFERSELDGMEGQYSTYQLDITKSNFIQRFDYDGHFLEYSEYLNKDENCGVMTITFDREIIYKATYPYDLNANHFSSIPSAQQPIYKAGMKCEIDNRRPSHYSIKFAEKLLSKVLKNEKKMEIQELEQEWFAFCRNDFYNLSMIFNFGNFKHFPDMNLKKALENSSSFPDVIFHTHDNSQL
ncbi:predicted protein [Naegleria gruberi]|uniref:Predicted protein n=1 Tax=Naegleria gruberi TaxID=5762 RepID=D2VC94_NAEGR|nr:uncharacterized protein NAEGRDRAFT_66490 [Naegleria gruberi]EFC45711.1 predicted protein [Naegleria gruberi]|eukprot:XP_002678455.1 predicted protein [Naegleria gruberi strain NEG-M]